MAQRKIVSGYNDTPQGEDALALGRVLAESLEGVAVVAVVAHYPRHRSKDGEDASLAEFCEPMFATARERLGDLKVMERPLADESPGRALHVLAEELNSKVMVLGSAHHGAAGRVIPGGVGESMLSGAPGAIAVAPLGYADRENGLDRIGVAVDGSAQAWRALQAGTVLAGRANARLRVLTVEPPHHYALGGALSPLSPEEYEQHKEKEAEGILDEAIEKIPSGLTAERSLIKGAPAEALAEAGEELDLLLVGSRGYGPLKGSLLGSVSSKLIKSAPCAVLVLPRGSGADPLED